MLLTKCSTITFIMNNSDCHDCIRELKGSLELQNVTCHYTSVHRRTDNVKMYTVFMKSRWRGEYFVKRVHWYFVNTFGIFKRFFERQISLNLLNWVHTCLICWPSMTPPTVVLSFLLQSSCSCVSASLAIQSTCSTTVLPDNKKKGNMPVSP